METLLAEFGYPVLLAGTFFEGETIVVIAGYLAHAGYLDIRAVAGVAALGTFLGDQLYFWIGRHWGAKALSRLPLPTGNLDRALALIERYDTWFILGFRFLYGVRSISSFAIGMSGVRPLRFLAFNAAAAVVWAIAVAALGYLFGQAVNLVLGEAKRYELIVLAVLAGVGLLIWGVHFMRRRRRQQRD